MPPAPLSSILEGFGLPLLHLSLQQLSTHHIGGGQPASAERTAHGFPLSSPPWQSWQKNEVCALRHSGPSCRHRLLALDSLPKPCSPALAGAQIPSTLHSLGLGKESGFLRFLTTLLPEHKDKELFISALLLNTAFLSQS